MSHCRCPLEAAWRLWPLSRLLPGAGLCGVHIQRSEPWCQLGRREAGPLGTRRGGSVPSKHHPLSAHTDRTEQTVAVYYQKFLSWSSRRWNPLSEPLSSFLARPAHLSS